MRANGKFLVSPEISEASSLRQRITTIFSRNQQLGGGYDIPTTSSVCPCYRKPLTIDDVKDNTCVYIDGKF